MAQQVESSGFKRGRTSPAEYMNEQMQVAVMVHGNDYLCSGPEASLIKRHGELAKVFESKHNILGHGAHQEKEGKLLNHLIRYTKGGWEIEATPRHGELIIKELTSRGARA